jgi:hypothetical protein
MAVLGDDIDLSFNDDTDEKSIFNFYKLLNFPISEAKSYFNIGKCRQSEFL